jgi:hypothetical protein
VSHAGLSSPLSPLGSLCGAGSSIPDSRIEYKVCISTLLALPDSGKPFH